MIKDIIKELELNETHMSPNYIRIQRTIYACKNDTLLMFGYEVESHIWKGYPCISNYRVAYIFQFTLDDDIKNLLKKADEIDKNPKIYMLEHPKHSEYRNMWKKGYVKILDCDVSHDFEILYALESAKRRADIINVNGFKYCLEQWVYNYPKYSYSDALDSDEKRMFLDEVLSKFECLLLSKDDELYNLYIKYKEKRQSYICEKMTFEH